MFRPFRCPPPDPSAPVGQDGFTFDRSGYRVPAIIVSPWVAEGEVFNQEHRHELVLAPHRADAVGHPEESDLARRQQLLIKHPLVVSADLGRRRPGE